MAKVLVVDDSVLARGFVRQALVEAGYEVLEASNGAEALELLDSEITCILCDVNMPVMDGIELLEALHASKDDAPPVLITSSESEASLVQRARELGAIGWITKPIRAHLLVAAVKRLCSSAEGEQRCGS